MSETESSTIPPLFNRLMSAMLRSPLHRLASRSVMLITFTGRKTGKRYSTPVSYLRQGNKITAFTGAKWSRNLVGGAPVTLNIKNKNYQGTAEVVEEKEAVAEGLRSFLNQVRIDARFYQVKFDDDGRPNWQDVQRAAQRCDMLQVQLNGADYE
jgi:deazaflavin-dependent oxidoreductase (nitroreductase family)